MGLQLAQQGDLVRAESESRQAAELAPADPEIGQRSLVRLRPDDRLDLVVTNYARFP